MRCFIAIDLPEEVQNEISKLQQRLPESKSRMVEPHNLHLTLVFLGEIADIHVNQAKEALKNIKFKKFKASTGNLGVFPSENFIRVVWISLQPAQIIKELHDLIFKELKKINLKNVRLDSRFESHITLARIKFVQDKKEFIEKLKSLSPKALEFEARSFVLKKSTLSIKVPVYEEISRFNLE